MSDTGDKRVTRQSVSEASAATDQAGDSFENFVRKSPTSMGAKMDSILAGQATLEGRCNIIETRVAKNESTVQDTIESINFNSDEVKDLTSEIATIEKQLKDYQIESQQARITITTLQSETNSETLQRYTRSFNVRFLGILEMEREDCVATVEGLVSKHFGVPPGVIENAIRVGQSSGGKPTMTMTTMKNIYCQNYTDRGINHTRSWQYNKWQRWKTSAVIS